MLGNRNLEDKSTVDHDRHFSVHTIKSGRVAALLDLSNCSKPFKFTFPIRLLNPCIVDLTLNWIQDTCHNPSRCSNACCNINAQPVWYNTTLSWIYCTLQWSFLDFISPSHTQYNRNLKFSAGSPTHKGKCAGSRTQKVTLIHQLLPWYLSMAQSIYSFALYGSLLRSVGLHSEKVSNCDLTVQYLLS